MSELTLTEQPVNPPNPGTDDGKKTVTLFGKDSTSTPGITVAGSIDSAGNVADLKGDQGDQGIPGPIGPTGPPGTLAVQIVVAINNPIELEALKLADVGSDIIAHQVIGAGISDLVTMYLYDEDGPAKNAPFVMNTGDGGTTRWIATSGRNVAGQITTTGNVNGRDMPADGAKLDGLATEMIVTGGISNLLADGANKVSWGEVGADASITMPFAGVVFAISLSLDTARTAGTCTASFKINDVLQDGAGEETVVDGTNPESNHQNLASPVAFLAGDTLDMQAATVGFAPTSADATVAIFIRRT